MTEMNAIDTPVRGPVRAGNVALWGLQILAATMFLFSGGIKFAGTPDMVALFAEIGLGQWFRYLTGALEVLGAVLLVVPRLCALGAVLLAGVMVGAVMTDLVIGNTTVPALVNLVVLTVIAWGRRNRLRALLPLSR